MKDKTVEDYMAMSDVRKEYNQHTTADIDVNVVFVNPNVVTTTDPVVLAVIKQLDERSQVGLKKYKKPLSEDERSLSEWCQMAIEESLDHANYLQKIIFKLKKQNL